MLASAFLSGGAGRDRTDDPLLAKQVLSQLSYSPSRFATLRCLAGACSEHAGPLRRDGLLSALRWWVWMDSNHRPPPYQDGALTS